MRTVITWLAVLIPMGISSQALADATNDAPVTPTPPPLPPPTTPTTDTPPATASPPPVDSPPVAPATAAPVETTPPVTAAPVAPTPPAAAAPVASVRVIPPPPSGDARSTKRPPGSDPEPTVGVGASMGGFFGLPYVAAALKLDVLLPGEEWIRPAILTELDVGSTEHGLRIFRTYFGAGGVFVLDRVRLGVGVRVAYTMVQRITKHDPFLNALFGDIGGFGIGPVAWLSLDIVRTDDFSIGPAVRVSGDIYKNAGTGYSGTALIEVRF